MRGSTRGRATCRPTAGSTGPWLATCIPSMRPSRQGISGRVGVQQPAPVAVILQPAHLPPSIKEPVMNTLHARVYVKTRHPFLAYTPGDELAGVTGPTGAPLLLTLSAQTPNDVPQQVYDVGNHAGADVNGVTWPSDVRAVSVGDVIHITSPDIPTDPGRWLAVASRGFTRITPPGNVRGLSSNGTESGAK